MSLEFTILRSVYHPDGTERTVSVDDIGIPGISITMYTDHIPGVFTPTPATDDSSGNPEQTP